MWIKSYVGILPSNNLRIGLSSQVLELMLLSNILKYVYDMLATVVKIAWILKKRNEQVITNNSHIFVWFNFPKYMKNFQKKLGV